MLLFFCHHDIFIKLIDNFYRLALVSAGYYNGMDKKYPYDINTSLRTKHIFDFDRVVASRASTCAVPGEVDYACVHCGAFYAVELPLLDHKWGDWTFNKDKTETLRVCKVCGAVEKKPA